MKTTLSISLSTIICLFGFSLHAGQQVYVETNSIVVNNIREVIINNSCLDVQITGSDTNILQLVSENLSENIEVKSQRDKQTFKISVERPFGFWNECKGKLIIQVPKECAIRCSGVSGTIDISNVNSPSIFVESVSGTCKLLNTHAIFDITTVSGSIHFIQAYGKKQIKTVSGDIKCIETDSLLEGKSISGSFTLENTRGNSILKTASGEIVMKNHTGTVNLKTISGRILGDAITLTGNSEFESTSGDISIDLTNNTDQIKFDTYSTAGRITVDDLTVSKSLAKGKGPFTISGKTISGTQIYK